MPRRRPAVTQAEITRAIKAAQAAGVKIGSVDVTPDGRIIIRAQGEPVPQSEVNA